MIRKIDDLVAAAEKIFLVVALSAMSLIIFFDFLFREIFSFGFVWGKELAAFMMIWVGFIGASLATKGNKHLVVGIPEKLFPKRIIHFVSFGVSLLVVVVTLFLAYLGYEYVKETYEFEETSLVLDIPLWIVQLIIPVSLFVITLRFIGLSIDILKKKVPAIGSGSKPITVIESDEVK